MSKSKFLDLEGLKELLRKLGGGILSHLAEGMTALGEAFGVLSDREDALEELVTVLEGDVEGNMADVEELYMRDERRQVEISVTQSRQAEAMEDIGMLYENGERRDMLISTLQSKQATSERGLKNLEEWKVGMDSWRSQYSLSNFLWDMGAVMMDDGWSVNGVEGITYAEMTTMLRYAMRGVGPYAYAMETRGWIGGRDDVLTPLRTNLMPLPMSARINDVWGWYGELGMPCVSVQGLFSNQNSLEVAHVGEALTAHIYVGAFENCFQLREIMGVIDFSLMKEAELDLNGSTEGMFSSCYQLREVRIRGIYGHFSAFWGCPKLSLDSVVYAVEHADAGAVIDMHDPLAFAVSELEKAFDSGKITEEEEMAAFDELCEKADYLVAVADEKGIEIIIR